MEQDRTRPTVAIVDYGLGNLFSVKQACEHAGLEAEVTSTAAQILGAAAVILPGVGAFGNAMDALRRLDLVTVIQEVSTGDKPLLGICLGAQLLLEESEEFGAHRGLGVLKGRVVSLGSPRAGDRRLKVPQVGWNRVRWPREAHDDPWHGTLLQGQANGEFMYFVHSFILRPEDMGVVLSTSSYGHVDFCSAVAWGNVTAFQFHPERSGPQGLRVYDRLAERIQLSEDAAERASV